MPSWKLAASATVDGDSRVSGPQVSPRDTQRARVYAAERLIEWTDDDLTLEECRSYCRSVSRSAWFRRTFAWSAGREITVHDGRGCRNALAASGSITLPRWARRHWVILHEIAHCVTSGRHAAHGPEFVANLLKLYRHFLGSEAYAIVREAMADHGVRAGARKLRIANRQPAEPSPHREASADATGEP